MQFSNCSIIDGDEEELKTTIFMSSSHRSFPSQADIIASGRELAKKMECGFMITSARTGHNTQAAFIEICRMIMVAQGHLEGKLNSSGSTQRMDPVNTLTHSMKLRQMSSPKGKKKSSCCAR